MVTPAENKEAFFLKMRSNVGKHAKIYNIKQQSLRREYLLFQKHIFLKFKNPRWQVDENNCYF